MTATSEVTASGPTATPTTGLRFDLIDRRAAEILGISVDELTEEALATLLGTDRKTIWRWRKGQYEPRQQKLRELSTALGISAEQLTRAGE